jgi:hypothetical protein
MLLILFYFISLHSYTFDSIHPNSALRSHQFDNSPHWFLTIYVSVCVCVRWKQTHKFCIKNVASLIIILHLYVCGYFVNVINFCFRSWRLRVLRRERSCCIESNLFYGSLGLFNYGNGKIIVIAHFTRVVKVSLYIIFHSADNAQYN